MKYLKQLYVTEHAENNKWTLSFSKPEFQGGETIEIDEETAAEILKIQNN